MNFKSEAKFIPYDEINDSLLNQKIIKRLQKIKRTIKRLKLEDHEIEDIAQKVFKFQVIDIKDEDCGGYCNFDKKIIGLLNNPKKQILRKRTFCHEIGHVILFEIGVDPLEFNNLLSYQVLIEQTCETIAFYLFDIFFPSLKKQKSKLKFNYYFSQEDYKFLFNWYKNQGYNIVNDLIPE